MSRVRHEQRHRHIANPSPSTFRALPEADQCLDLLCYCSLKYFRSCVLSRALFPELLLGVGIVQCWSSHCMLPLEVIRILDSHDAGSHR